MAGFNFDVWKEEEEEEEEKKLLEARSCREFHPR
jgi:hypothetical protein